MATRIKPTFSSIGVWRSVRLAKGAHVERSACVEPKAAYIARGLLTLGGWLLLVAYLRRACCVTICCLNICRSAKCSVSLCLLSFIRAVIVVITIITLIDRLLALVSQNVIILQVLRN